MKQRQTRRTFLKIAGLAAIGQAAISAKDVRAKGKPAAPNIVLILSDDQSWAGTSVPMMAERGDTASDFFQTPNIERLAREGMRFSSAYSPAPVCSPTRSSIQYGKTPARLRNTCHNNNHSDCEGEISIAQMIKEANGDYVTAHLGKWHMTREPEDLGYDQSDGRMGNGNGSYFKNENGEKIRWPDDDPKQIFSLTGRANAFMAQQVRAGRPFFLQISHFAMHVAHQAQQATKEKYRDLPAGRKHNPNDYEVTDNENTSFVTYAAMTDDWDGGVGMTLDKIDELGITDNTYVFYMADNGGLRDLYPGLNKPLSGGKATLWEGGIRVPMIVRGPGVEPGSKCDVPVVGYDLLPTISELIGNRNALPDGIDGGSLLPVLRNGGRGKVARPIEELIFHFPFYFGPQSAIRQGKYKLLIDWEADKTMLFDLDKDIGEHEDLAEIMPEKTAVLNRKLRGFLKAVNAEKFEDIQAEARRLGKK